jgi:hypothetical protein
LSQMLVAQPPRRSALSGARTPTHSKHEAFGAIDILLVQIDAS